jgi:ATP-binding cassette subfamily B protein
VIKVSSVKDSILHVLENLGRMLSIAWEADKKFLSFYFIISGIGALFPIAASFLYKLLVDNLVASQNITVGIPVILFAILGARYVVGVSQDFVMGSLRNTYFDILVRNRVQNELNLRFYRKISNLDIAHLENPETQDLIAKASDTFTWRPPEFVRRATYIFTNFVEYIAAFLLLVPFGWTIPIIVSFITIPQLLVRTRFGKLQWSIYGSGAPEARKLWYFRWLLSDRTAVTETRIFQSQKELLKKFKKIQEYLYNLNKKPLDDYMKVAPLPQIFEGLFVFGFALWKLPAVLNGVISVGDYTFFISLLDRVVSDATNVVFNFGLLYEHNLYVDHYFDVLGLPRLVKPPRKSKRVPPRPFPPKVEFKNVEFTYPGSNRKVLKDVSFDIEPGKNFAIVGPNGAGKTTIVKLLCRFYDVDSGEILINDVNIKNIDIGDWYKYLGTLFQNFVHYNLTVRENIMLGNTKVKDEKLMREAAKKSGAIDFIKKFPKKYNQMLGRRFEHGEDLSKGQWQELAIARTFYENAPLLILDEPTSAIDAEAEYEIFKNLNKYYKDKSLFLISHRFSTVRNADKIVVLDKGKIIEEGTHEELVKLSGRYAQMFKKQAIGYK